MRHGPSSGCLWSATRPGVRWGPSFDKSLHFRHLTTEQKDQLNAAILKAQRLEYERINKLTHIIPNRAGAEWGKPSERFKISRLMKVTGFIAFGYLMFTIGSGLKSLTLGEHRILEEKRRKEVGPQYADEQTMVAALKDLSERLQLVSSNPPRTAKNVADMISTELDDLESHSHSTWSTANSSIKPHAIIYPTCTADVVEVAKICTRHKIPMIPYGAGSSVEGSFSSPHSGFTIDMSRMDKIIAFHEQDMDIVVQPGVNWMDLNNQLKSHGLFLPLDPGPQALIGGMIATNCSGPNAMRYGSMKEWVLNVTMVLADGTIVKTRRRARKSSAGYDLTRLVVGAEGTLGIVTEATLKLAIIPPNMNVATCAFPDIDTAANAAIRMIRQGIGGLAALEFMDEVQMQLINKNGGTIGKDGKTRRLWKEQPTLFIKFSGTDKTIADDVDRVRQITKELGGSPLEVARNEQEKDAIWAARKEVLYAMLANRDEGTEIWSTDVAVPLSRLAEIITISKKESSQLGLFNSVLGHVGDGNFHQSVFYHPIDRQEKENVARCVNNMMVRALEMEGTVSGEHAIGIGKKTGLASEVGPETLDMMRELKLAVDPFWLMNPGKIFDWEQSRVTKERIARKLASDSNNRGTVRGQLPSKYRTDYVT